MDQLGEGVVSNPDIMTSGFGNISMVLCPWWRYHINCDRNTDKEATSNETLTVVEENYSSSPDSMKHILSPSTVFASVRTPTAV